jgi:hypothetical protein
MPSIDGMKRSRSSGQADSMTGRSRRPLVTPNGSPVSDAPALTELERAAARIRPESALTAIAAAVSGLKFGQVTVIVHESRVVQIERTERQRLSATSASDDAGESIGM